MDPDAEISPKPVTTKLMEPLGYTAFRTMWLASLLSNLGFLIQGVGAAWVMSELTRDASQIALIQTATMLPVLLIAVPAGAVTDMYDRKIVGIVALILCLAGAGAMFTLAYLDRATPASLLLLSFVIGSGMALFLPSWQSSVVEQVPAEAVSSAVALNSISYNMARSFGPALGGFILSLAGAASAFAATIFLYLPMFGLLLRSPRTKQPSRLPPEGIGRALVSGGRYVINSPAIRAVIARATLLGFVGVALLALMPLIARDLLGADASIFGILLGAFGLGAVLGAFAVSSLRHRFGYEGSMRLSAIALAVSVAIVAVSRSELLTSLALVVSGMGWMVATTTLNVAVQLPAPRWVTGRAIATFHASLAGGGALGSWVWGSLADATSVDVALLGSSALIVAFGAIGILWWRVEDSAPLHLQEVEPLSEPEVRLGLTGRSGPVVIEIEYRVPLGDARPFYQLMQDVRLTRLRNGAFGWSLARDIASPELWVERYHCPTWLDFLRARSRATAAERLLQEQARAFHSVDEPVRIRRMLERPFGSVRWKDEVPDHGGQGVMPLPPPSA